MSKETPEGLDEMEALMREIGAGLPEPEPRPAPPTADLPIAAIAGADELSPPSPAPAGWRPPPSPPGSPTLAQLDSDRRPVVPTVCEGCPNSVWFSSAIEVKCYCRVMFTVTWSNREPVALTGCDGQFVGQE